MNKYAYMLTGVMLLSASATAAQSGISVAFADPTWTGQAIPEGQHCPLQGGTGATPALSVSGLPEGTASIDVAFNDETYQPMDQGGHGVLNFVVTPENGSATLPSVPGNTADNLPEGVTIAAPSRGSGDYASPGYLPPCSGGNGNTYTATVTALDASGASLGESKITLGTY